MNSGDPGRAGRRRWARAAIGKTTGVAAVAAASREAGGSAGLSRLQWIRAQTHREQRLHTVVAPLCVNCTDP